MEVRPGCKQTEVGVIPEEWLLQSLGAVCDVRDGTHESPNFFKHGMPFVTSKNIIDGRLDLENVSFISQQDAIAFNKRSKVDRNDILMSMIGTIGSAVLVDFEPDFCIKNVALVKPQTIEPTFLIQLINSPQFQAYLGNSLDGGIQKFVALGTLRRLIIPVPALLEQRAIAGALGDVDALLGALAQLIAKKRDLKQAAMQQLLTGQTRLPGFSGEWEVKRLSDVADKTIPWSIGGGPFGSNLKASDYVLEGVRIIQLQNIGDGTFHDNYAIYTSEAKADELLSNNIYPGEIILSKMGDPVARACLVPSLDRRYLMASDGIRLAVDSRGFDKQFILDYINSSYFRKQAVEASTGSTRQRIGLSELKLLSVAAPPLAEQTAIATVLSDMDAELAALEQRLAKTRALKQGMMQELLTGRTRLV